MSKFVGTGPSSYKKKRIYRAAVSQRLRNTTIRHFKRTAVESHLNIKAPKKDHELYLGYLMTLI